MQENELMLFGRTLKAHSPARLNVAVASLRGPVWPSWACESAAGDRGQVIFPTGSHSGGTAALQWLASMHQQIPAAQAHHFASWCRFQHCGQAAWASKRVKLAEAEQRPMLCSGWHFKALPIFSDRMASLALAVIDPCSC